MYKNNLECSLGCSSPEDQEHALTKCLPLLSKTNTPLIQHEYIYGDTCKQKTAAVVFMELDIIRNEMKDALLPGGATSARTQSR